MNWNITTTTSRGPRLCPSTVAGRWVLAVVMPGDASAVRQRMASVYGGAGFTPDSGGFILRRPGYVITLAMDPRDHSATATNVSFQLVRR